MKCQACPAEITKYRVVGVYDQSKFTPDLLKQGKINTYFYVGGTFIPLAMTRCPQCGHVDFWDPAAPLLKGLSIDKEERDVFQKEE